MRSSFAYLLALMPFTFASPVDNLETLRKTNRLVGRQANATITREILHANYEFITHMMSGQHAAVKTDSGKLEKRQARTGRATGPKEDPYSAAYYFKVPVGKDILNMHFSTESSDFWVYSSKLPAAQQKGHHVYKLGGTKAAGRYTDIELGQFVVKGDIYLDTVKIGGYSATQEIETATTMSDFALADTPVSDGVVGYGWPTNHTGCRPYSAGDCKPWWLNISPQMPSPGFAVTMRPSQAIWDQGFIDPAQYTGQMVYVQGYYERGGWDFFSEGVSYGTNAPMIDYGQQLYTSLQTDNLFILTHPTIAADYYAKVKGAMADSSFYGYYTFPCSSKLPDFNLFVKGRGQSTVTKRTVSATHLNLEPTSNGRCVGAIQEFSHPDIQVLLGVPFYKSQYVHFNNDAFFPPLVGLAPQK